MRSRILFVAVLIIVVLGIGLGAVYLRNQSANSVEAVPSASPSPMGSASPLPSGSPSPDPSASPSPGASVSADGQPVAQKSSNPNPDLTVDSAGLSRATVLMNTTQGLIKLKFYPNEAPNTVKRVIELIQQGFYNGLTFHRVHPNFIIQTGDPTKLGNGGSGQKLKAEFNDRKHGEGAVAMARGSDPHSADSQFYITVTPQPQLDHSYTVFGQVIEGMDVVRRITVADKINTMIVE